MATMRELIIQEMVWRGESWQDVEAVEIDFHESRDGFWRDKFGEPDRTANKYPFYDTNPNVQIQSLTVDELLDLEFDDGYGSECPFHPIVWTKSRIYYHHEYDGSDSIRSLSRYPKEKKDVV